MLVAATISALRAYRTALDTAGTNTGLVPTMGALHAGHTALIKASVRENPATIVSIFVNPTQFDRAEDLTSYPRTFDDDLGRCESLGVSAVFAPSDREMYPSEPRAAVSVASLTSNLCGKFRPGHFDGVATVVTKLFQIVQPGRAYFGEKDYQQLAIIRRLVADLNIPVEIRGVPTVREPDGLALSSRNRRLAPDHRAAAAAIPRALKAVQEATRSGPTKPASALAPGLRILHQEPQLRPEYLEIVDPVTLEPAETLSRPVRIAAAVWAGEVRLIDNLPAEPRATSAEEEQR